jgi:RND superfamily putative drug exporter
VLNAKLQEMVEGISKLNNALTTANSSMEKANKGLGQAENGIAAMKDGTSKLKQGSSEMSHLLAQGAVGQEKISDALGQLVEGSKQLAGGQNQLIEGLKKISADSGKLVNGLSDARQGLADLSQGLHDAQAYMEKLSRSKTATSFFIPEDQIHGKAFSKSMDQYMSPDRRITKINIQLTEDPYSEKAMEVVRHIQQIVTNKIKDSSLKEAEWGLSGVPQMNVDLNAMSGNDFKISSAIMLAGILIVLLIVTRDLWMSVMIMISLIAAYYISFSISGLIFGRILGNGNLTWNVPFFSFLMIIALGVDYSIFLIMRQRENRDMPSTQSIILAAKNVGGVIFSAAIILSGTFAAMYPSGVITLRQLSITVILGIMLLNLIFLPVFLPAMFALKFKFMKH